MLCWAVLGWAVLCCAVLLYGQLCRKTRVSVSATRIVDLLTFNNLSFF